jgi:transcriptional regulator with XRE-family HTH domain
MTIPFEKLKARLLANPKVKAEYDALAPEFEIAAELLRARLRAGLSQAELAARMGTSQSTIARLENGHTLRHFCATPRLPAASFTCGYRRPDAPSRDGAHPMMLDCACKPNRPTKPAGQSSRLLLLLPGSDARLPTRRAALLARRRRYRLDLFFFRLLGFPIAFLLAFSHVALLGVGDKQLSLPGGLVSYRGRFDYMVS